MYSFNELGIPDTIIELQVSLVPQSKVLVKGPTYYNSTFPYSHSRITSHNLRFLNDIIFNNDAGMKDNKPKYVATIDQPELGVTLKEINVKVENLNELEKSSLQEYTNGSISNFTYSPNSIPSIVQAP